MLKIKLLFIVLAINGILFSQENVSLHINWNTPRVVVDGEQELKFLNFDQVNYIQGATPSYSLSLDVNSDDYIDSIIITDAQYVDFTSEELLILSKLQPSEMITYAFATEKKQRKLSISLIPIDFAHKRKLVSASLVVYKSSQLNSPKLRSTNTSGIHSYVSSSKLASGDWVKISVSTTGVYKISYEDLVSWGVPNPANANVFGYGGALLAENFTKSKYDDLPQLSVWKEKGADGIFNAGDYILFYAQGPVSWSYNTSKQEYQHTNNYYSNLGYYFISSSVGAEKLISNKTLVTATPTDTVDYSISYSVYEKEEFSLLKSGREWYGEEFGTTSNRSFNFGFLNVDTSKAAKLTVDAIANAGAISSSMSMYLNNVPVGSAVSFSAVSSKYHAAQKGSSTYSFTPDANSFTVKLLYNQANVGKAWLNYIRMNVPTKLNVSGAFMGFRNPSVVAPASVVKYDLTNAGSYYIWDVTKHADIKSISLSNNAGVYSFVDSAATYNEYVAVNPNLVTLKPVKVVAVINQNLHSLNDVDFVIITHPDYATQANLLAQAHNQKEGISVAVVSTEQVYNEFSSGTPDATAYRWLMKMLYDKAPTLAEQPKSLLLFGDGIYDNRLITASNAPNAKVLTFQSYNSIYDADQNDNSYVCDDYLAFLDDNEGVNLTSDLMDIGVGRFPVSTTQQANEVTIKVLQYMDNQLKGPWKKRLCYVADDDDNTLHTWQSDTLASYIQKNYPAYQPVKIYLDAFNEEVSSSSESYPLAKEKLLNLISSGVFLINYTGHGSSEALASEKILSRVDVQALNNTRLPLFVTATCGFSRFDEPVPSTGEELLLNPNGGAVALFSTTRTVYAQPNFELNRFFHKNIFKQVDGSSLSLGEIMRNTKNSRTGDNNKMNFTLLGDPALKVDIAKDVVHTLSIESNSDNGQDTLNALSVVHITGEIRNPEGSKRTDFNGLIYVTVYDKEMKVTTLANDGGQKFSFYDRSNVLFSGKAKVVNGDYIVDMMIPKDIAYNFGKGRISFYAFDETHSYEAVGYNEDIVVGGSVANFSMEYQGPTINSMYLNTPSFVNGQKVNAQPLFVANVSDENGINVTGIGIGHDLTLSLNEDPSKTFNLNEYYESSIGNYNSGTVKYSIPTLPNGSYDLSFKVWDLLNNSTTGSLLFVVSDDVDPKLDTVTCYPNPVVGDWVKFKIKHDRPQQDLRIKVTVYSLLNGIELWSIEDEVFAETEQTEVSWNVKDYQGTKIPTGIYLYNVEFETLSDGQKVRTARKLIVQ